MKKSFKILISLTTLWLGVNLGYGAVLVQEDYESYSAGTLNGQNGGSGWSNAWSAVDGITAVVDVSSDPLSYTFSNGHTINGGNRALSVTGNNNFAAQRDFYSSFDSNFYVAFLIRLEQGTLQNNDFATVWFGTGTFNGAPAIGLKANQGDGSGVNDLMGRITGNQETYEGEVNLGETNYLVARVSKSNDIPSANYDTLEFWHNPEYADVNNPDGVSTIANGINFTSFAGTGIRSVNLDQGPNGTVGDNVLFDNLTYASSWSDVVIPEPSTAILISLGAGSMLLRRKRN